MGTHYLTNADGTRYGIMTYASIYQYGGFTFEVHPYLGPLKLKKDYDPASCMGRKFFKIYDKWNKLTPEEKLETLIFG
jgi:hypothetical protein